MHNEELTKRLNYQGCGEYILNEMNNYSRNKFIGYHSMLGDYKIKLDQGLLSRINQLNESILLISQKSPGLVQVKDKKRFKEISDIVAGLNKQKRKNIIVMAY